MIGLRFPDVDVPAGWTASDRGPRRWLLPPAADAGRIVLLPLLPRRKRIEPQQVLEASLAGELERFASVKQTPFAPATAGGLAGVSTEVALLGPGDALVERRAYVALADERAVYTLFLQARPEAYPDLKEAFSATAASLRPLA
jgi:hypothetical protein